MGNLKMRKKAVNSQSTFKPLYSVLYVSDRHITELRPEEVTVDLVGEKAFGLSCLPKLWTLPFIVVSHTLLIQFNNCPEESRDELLKQWSKQIISAALDVGLQESDNIIVRSSGCSEGLDERGKFYSEDGNLTNLIEPLSICLIELSLDKTINQQMIPLVVQKYVTFISAKGHLSNERRCYENRDWLGELEIKKLKVAQPFKINLRNWRKKIVADSYIREPLKCSLLARVSEVLKIPAAWIYNQKIRIHFEWVWDGSRIYLVQADRENENQGFDPVKVYKQKFDVSTNFLPKCLKKISLEHAKRYEKIRNVFTYLNLNLPITNLYVLDDQSVIQDLALGNVSSDLEDDIRELVKGSLVIRTDIETQDKNKRQLLPRTPEVRDLESALNWLKTNSAKLKSEIQEDLVFIFHNFVPAVSSAFAYAAPGERKVQIEALWGIPEGLYYNSHDKYIVDTQTPQLNKLNIQRFTIIEKRKYKRFFISPDEDGHWTIKLLTPPYDWKGSIQKKEWIKEIAFQSRRIAEEEGRPLSIMWFVNVSSKCCQSKVFPWHHEYYDSSITKLARSYRPKTPFDKTLTIRRNDDIEQLRQEAENPESSLKIINIQPCDEDLIRNKDILRVIGDLTKKIGATIQLEGGVLSHAYYQLMETKATVEVKHPFDDVEDKREFNKLVRDKIPLNIEQGGEIVNQAQLTGEHLLKALREKLVEEAFEVLDAIDQDSIIGELADVSEIIDGILFHLAVRRNELRQRQKQKRDKAGGFKNGIVLLETRNPLPTKKGLADVTLFEGINFNEKLVIDESTILKLSYKIEDWTDKREHVDATEKILHLVIPMVRDKWMAESNEKFTDINGESSIKIRLTGSRLGAKHQIELSVFNQQHKQLTIFELEKSDDKNSNS